MQKEKGPLPESPKSGNSNVQQNLELKDGLRPPGGAENASGGQAESDKVLLAKLREFYRQLHSPFIGKEEEAKAITLAFMCLEHEVTFGKRGTSKSALSIRALGLIESKEFQTQLNGFSTPEVVVGTYKPDKFRFEGTIEYKTESMLPEAQVARIDEVFRGTDALRGVLHSILFERIFHNGSKIMECPLMTVLAASEFVPYDEADQAFYDRFLFRFFTSPVPKGRVPELLDAARDIEFKGASKVSAPVISASDFRIIYEKLYDVDISIVKPILISLLNEIADKAKDMYLSDRRKGKILKAVAANALLEGRKTATIEDLIALKYVLPNDEEETRAISAILENLISPVNHINRLDAATFSINAAIEALDKNPESQVNHADAMSAVSNAKKYAKALLKEYSDKSLKKSARRLLKSARIYSEKVSKSADTANQGEVTDQDTSAETDQ